MAEQPSVDLGSVRVLDGDLAASGASDGELIAQIESTSGEGGGFDDRQLHRSGSTVDTFGFTACFSGVLRDELRTTDLDPYGSENAKEKEVQEGQQAQLEDGEELLVHSSGDSTGPADLSDLRPGDDAPGSGRLEGDGRVPEGDLITFAKFVDIHANTIDAGAVGRAEVDEHPSVALGSDLGMVAADVGIGQLHGRFGATAEGHGRLTERDPITGCEDQ